MPDFEVKKHLFRPKYLYFFTNLKLLAKFVKVFFLNTISSVLYGISSSCLHYQTDYILVKHTITALGSFLVAVVYVIKQLFYSLSSYMSDRRLGTTHLVSYQLIYDTNS